MKFRNEEYRNGDKTLFYRGYYINPRDIYGIAEIMGVHSNRENSSYIDYGAVFRGDTIYFRIEKTQDFREYSSVGMLCLEAL